jgi:nicotinamide riboside kinase
MKRIALLGAESTGKSQLAAELAQALQARGLRVTVIPEGLRDWCDRLGRTPRPDEQASIALAQAHAVLAAQVDGVDVVIADTTPLMTAVYSDYLFQDRSLYAQALAHQQGYDLTLLTGLDLPWVADGLQRDGPQVREPVDALLRQALTLSGLRWQVVYGAGPARVQAALRAWDAHCAQAARPPEAATPAWTWACDSCSDPDCEHRLFSRLLGR